MPRNSSITRKLRISIIVIVCIGGFVSYLLITKRSAQAEVGDAIVEISVPEFSGNRLVGQAVFTKNCAACHGLDAVGSAGNGPPLIHKIYEPSHQSYD
jgi:mono/diheme cytochrome c family protein